jgi:medium-chain acyl-[acyl-carrier-protein] hydrolase
VGRLYEDRRSSASVPDRSLRGEMHVMRPLIERFTTNPADPSSPVLFTISHAGAGAAAFFGLRKSLPGLIELAAIRLPGRESYLREPPIKNFKHAAQLVVTAIQSWHPARYAVFGQCSGALLAFEVVRELRRSDGLGPDHLFVASQSPPDEKLSDSRIERANYESFDEAALFRELTDLDLLPAEIEFGGAIWKIVAPAIRADLQLMADYKYSAEEPLETPITAICGNRDSHLSEKEISGWARQTREFAVCTVPSGHLVTKDASAAVGEIVLHRWNRQRLTDGSDRSLAE